MTPLQALKHHVSGAIARCEKDAIVEKRANTIKARLVIGSRAYALITGDIWEMNVLLSPGQSASKSLISTAAEYRAKAEKLIRDADRLIEASELLKR